MAEKDLYAILGVSRGVDEKELKRAYRKLAKKYHPDTNQGDTQAELKFKEVNEAYDILSDPEKRKLYDQFGMAAFDGSMNGTSGQGNPFEHGYSRQQSGPYGSYREYHYSSDNMDDVFEDFFGGMFGGSGRGRKRTWDYDSSFGGERSRAESMQTDLHADITISFEEAALGCDKLLSIDGAGKEQLRVHIPAGIDEGQSVRLKGKGHAGYGGQRGDLFLKVHISESAVYERKGQDVYTKAWIPYTTAALGGDALFQTLYGKVQCHVPAGTQCGSKIRLKNKGIVSMKNPSIKGNEYVIIQIEVPGKLSPEERAVLEKLKKAEKKRTGFGGAA